MEKHHTKTYQKLYANKGNQAVLALVKGVKATILDVGCGAGDNARILSAEGHVVDGITLSETEALACREIMRNVYVYNLELGIPEELSESYDFILCSHVLEHIVYPQAVLKGMHSLLKENGRIIVALPNVMQYRSRIKLLLGDFNYEESGIWDYTHVRWYTFRSAIKLLEDNGFVVEKGFVDGDIPFLTLFRFVPYNIRKLIYKMLTTISKGLFGGQMIYVARLTQGIK